jgi:hypothetical protein
MKYTIKGELDVEGDLTHQEMIHKLFAILAAYGFRFEGETKQVKE